MWFPAMVMSTAREGRTYRVAVGGPSVWQSSHLTVSTPGDGANAAEAPEQYEIPSRVRFEKGRMLVELWVDVALYPLGKRGESQQDPVAPCHLGLVLVYLQLYIFAVHSCICWRPRLLTWGHFCLTI